MDRRPVEMRPREEAVAPFPESGLTNLQPRRESEEKEGMTPPLRILGELEAEVQFRTLVEQSLFGIYILQDGLFRYVNPKFAEIFAYSQEEIIDRSPEDLVAPEDWPLVQENIRRRLSGEIEKLVYSVRGRRKDGARIDVEIHSSLTEFQGKPAIIGALRNITKLNRALEALKRRDTILEAVSFAAAGFLKTIDWQKNISEVLERLGQATGVGQVSVFENYRDDSGSLEARLFARWFSPDFAPGADKPTYDDFSWEAAGMENWTASLSQGEPVWGCFRKWGRKWSIIDVPIFVEGNWWGIIGFEDALGEREWSVEEIEALKAAAGIIGGAVQRDQAQKALQRQQTLLRTIFHTIPDLIVLKDRDLVHRAVNPAYCRFLGRTEEEIVGKTDQDLFPPAEVDIYCQEDLRVMDSGQPLAKDLEVTGAHGKHWLQVLKTPVLDEEGATSGILCSFRDISARKKAEATLESHRARLQTIIAERIAGGLDEL